MSIANWKNRTMWTGDNLDIMRGMNSESVDLIYADPPFNSKHNYAAPIGSEAAGAEFKDTWTLDDIKVEWHGLIAEENPALYNVINATMTKSDRAYLIYMAIRMLEMRRVLRPTGSIYLHCDPTMSHYLKLAMDAVFGRGNFRNEIVWKRNSSHNDSQVFGRITDTLLFYGHRINTEQVRVPLNPEYVKKFYRHTDPARGRYRAGDLTAKGLSGGGYEYDYHGHIGPWRYPEARMHDLEKDGRIHFPAKEGGVPCLKRFLNENRGQVPANIWLDIPPVQGSSKEKTGYPTQKPITLLDRIIQASSPKNGVVLDPFCGCATACISAEKNVREWVGIDISSKAYDLVNVRMRKELGMFGQVIHRTDIPKRDDLGELPSYRTHKHTLFGKQEGLCAGCEAFFPFRNFTIDHIIPQSKGGHDGLENLQLLCGACNSTKGNRDQAYLMARLKEDGIL